MMEFTTTQVILLVIISLWSLPWKGLAMWRAGKLNAPIWFTVFLLVHTAGLLEIYYLFIHTKKSTSK